MDRFWYKAKWCLVFGLALFISSQTWMRFYFESVSSAASSLGLYLIAGSIIFLIVAGLKYDRQKAIVLIILSIAGLAMAAPFIWMMLSAFKPNAEIFQVRPTFFPKVWTLSHFKSVLGIGPDALKNYNFGKYYLNSIKISLTVTLISAFANTFIGFVFCKYRFHGKKILFSMLLGTMMIPFPVTIIPVFLIMGRVHLLDTHIALILPGLIGAYGIFLMSQFIKSIPNDLFDAARIDGCSELRLYSIIILPSCKPIMFALSLFTFIASWNNVVWPMILLQSQEKYTLPLALMSFRNEYNMNYGLVLAATSMIIIPIIIFFLIVQKQLIKGITMTGLKG